MKNQNENSSTHRESDTVPGWKSAAYVVNAEKAFQIKKQHGFDPLLMDRSQAAIRLCMPVEKFEQHLGCTLAPQGIDPDNLIFRADDIEDYAIRLHGNAAGKPVCPNSTIATRPAFMSREFFKRCDEVQAGAMTHDWPNSAVMMTVTLASPNVTDIAGFNSYMLAGPAKTHVNVLFDMLQEQKHGPYRYRKRKIASPAVVIPERITRKKNDEPRKLITLHYHAVIGFEDHDEAIQFNANKGQKLSSKARNGLKNGSPRGEAPNTDHQLFHQMDIDLTVFDAGEGHKAFSYACKYAYDLIGYSRVLTPLTSSWV
mgnify:CR=1 FL=1